MWDRIVLVLLYFWRGRGWASGDARRWETREGGRADVHYRVTGGKASKSPTIAVSQRQVT